MDSVSAGDDGPCSTLTVLVVADKVRLEGKVKHQDVEKARVISSLGGTARDEAEATDLTISKS